jgi:hypothetical protein
MSTYDMIVEEGIEMARNMTPELQELEHLKITQESVSFSDVWIKQREKLLLDKKIRLSQGEKWLIEEKEKIKEYEEFLQAEKEEILEEEAYIRKANMTLSVQRIWLGLNKAILYLYQSQQLSIAEIARIANTSENYIQMLIDKHSKK